MKKVLVLDFGGQYNLLVARRVRECGVYCEIAPADSGVETVRAFSPLGLIVAGGEGEAALDPELTRLGVPVLGVGAGALSLVRALGGDRYEITTEALRIVYEHDGFPFGLHNFAAYYKLNGKEKKFTNRCIFRNNLGGPVETLDRVTGEIPMQDGLLSRDGWYVIDDERSDLLVDGWLRPRDTRSHVQDQYCFVYGNDYKAALADLGTIGGRVPMTRKYIHGVWYCRYWDYTSEEFLSIIDGYEQNDFPLDNLVFDMGWHTYTARTGTGHAGSRSWTGYTWERERIPDPEALIAEVHRRGVTVSLNDHPHDGIRPHEEMYAAFMADMGDDPAHPLLFDLGDRKYMETFFKHAHHASDRKSVV